MKKLTNFRITLMMGAVFFIGCDSDDRTDVVIPTTENSVPNGTVQFTLSVHVTPSSEKARVSGLNGAKVTINQSGSISTLTVGTDGIAVFSGLSEGPVSIYVSASNFSSFNITTTLFRTIDIDGTAGTGSDVAHVQFARVPVTLQKIGAI